MALDFINRHFSEVKDSFNNVGAFLRSKRLHTVLKALAPQEKDEKVSELSLEMMHHPFSDKKIGLEIQDARKGIISSKYKTDLQGKEHANRYGSSHGGVISTAIDANAACVGTSLLTDKEIKEGKIVVNALNCIGFEKPIKDKEEVELVSKALGNFTGDSRKTLPVITVAKVGAEVKATNLTLLAMVDSKALGV